MTSTSLTFEGLCPSQHILVDVHTDVRLKAVGEGALDDIHVDTVGVGPGVDEVLLEALTQAARDLVETDELLDAHHLGVVARRAAVETLDYRAHVAEDARVHQG